MKALIRTTLMVLLPLILLFSSFSFINADELSDIEQKLKDANLKLQKAQQDTNNLLSQTSSVNQSLSQVKKNISDIQNQINNYNTSLTQITADLDAADKLIKQKQSEYDELITQMSQTTRRTTLSNLLSNNKLSGFYNEQAIYKTNLQKQTDDIRNLGVQLDALNKLRADTETLKKSIESQLADLNAKKSEYENQLNQINSGIAYNKKLQGSLSNEISTLVNSRGLLTARLNETKQNVEPLKPGSYYFTGKGRYLYDGHGVGGSQWGYYGMAQNFGFTADKILKFYYTGVALTTMPPQHEIVVDGKAGPMSFDTYLAGIGEVPNDWPKEAVKAQIISARTYAMKSAKVGSDGYYHICGTDQCQVYVGGTAKQWAVDATKDQVLTYNGGLISAVYSAFHVGHSEDNEKTGAYNANVYGNGGNPLPYLRGVDDSQYAYKPKYPCSGSFVNGVCVWRTNGYSLDELSTIFASNSLTNVGKISNINIQRGSSERSWKVTLTGSTATKTVAGWVFKDTFNQWIGTHKPDGSRDYIYSLFFYFGQQ